MADTAEVEATLLSSKRVVYVGGLGDNVSQHIVRAAFIPFGPLKSVDIPMDYKAGTTRGFAFVEYEDADDATEAIFNMDGSDLMGRTIKVSLAQQNQLNKLISGTGSSSQAIWSSDEWFQQHVAGQGSEEDQKREREMHQDGETLKD
ncbi:RNA-binding protein [Nitzschia inconspicua]|uniref:RNA-binding protein n=1 Tax=Nitzschia inconspicua TaxID=303405 RepID=A0A9K3LSX7_9STRA|nr:RNA-binding protein [Nitzschia inconspicua]